MIRLGLLSDLHCELTPAGSRWINAFEPEHLDRRVDEALAWFAEAGVDAILVLGDVIQIGDVDDLEHVLDRLAVAASAPLAAVNGNHDLRIPDEFDAAARSRGIRLLAEEPLELDALTVAGVRLRRSGPGLPFYAGAYAPPSGDGILVLASHFPLLTEAERVAGAGIPYAGDLVNRAEIADPAVAARPTIGLSGHIHARCSRADGSFLQFTVGALIEPPFDCTLLEVDATGGRVTRTARRLGPIAAVDPVFARDEEAWSWSGQSWQRSGT